MTGALRFKVKYNSSEHKRTGPVKLAASHLPHGYSPLFWAFLSLLAILISCSNTAWIDTDSELIPAESVTGSLNLIVDGTWATVPDLKGYIPISLTKSEFKPIESGGLFSSASEHGESQKRDQLNLDQIYLQLNQVLRARVEKSLFSPVFRVKENGVNLLDEVDGDLAPWGFIIAPLDDKTIQDKWNSALSKAMDHGLLSWNFRSVRSMGDTCIAFGKNHRIPAIPHFWDNFQKNDGGIMMAPVKQHCKTPSSYNIWCVSDLPFSACARRMLGGQEGSKDRIALLDNFLNRLENVFPFSNFIADEFLGYYYLTFNAENGRLPEILIKNIMAKKGGDNLWRGSDILFSSSMALLALMECGIKAEDLRVEISALISYFLDAKKRSPAAPFFAPMIPRSPEGVKPSDVEIGGMHVRYYLYEDFKDLFARSALLALIKLVKDRLEFLPRVEMRNVGSQHQVEGGSVKSYITRQIRYFVQKERIEYEPAGEYFMTKWWHGWPVSDKESVHR